MSKFNNHLQAIYSHKDWYIRTLITRKVINITLNEK